MSLFQVAMQKKTYFDFAITITLLFTIIISLLLPRFAYEDQHLALENQQSTMIKNEINNNVHKHFLHISYYPFYFGEL